MSWYRSPSIAGSHYAIDVFPVLVSLASCIAFFSDVRFDLDSARTRLRYGAVLGFFATILVNHFKSLLSADISSLAFRRASVRSAGLTPIARRANLGNHSSQYDLMR